MPNKASIKMRRLISGTCLFLLLSSIVTLLNAKAACAQAERSRLDADPRSSVRSQILKYKFLLSLTCFPSMTLAWMPQAPDIDTGF
jgi:hypothetical protein